MTSREKNAIIFRKTCISGDTKEFVRIGREKYYGICNRKSCIKKQNKYKKKYIQKHCKGLKKNNIQGKGKKDCEKKC